MKPLIAQLQSCSWATKVGHNEPMAKTLGCIEDIATHLERDPDVFSNRPTPNPMKAYVLATISKPAD
ncbi:hypothetical protein [Shewanella mangrovisoli]|uniref:Uncharacterized protein n=1 Tax=Shewanella mangrovisoli TaxID=2864211 RepID=A0ABV4VJN7_9GAMM